jgi:rubredoxin
MSAIDFIRSEVVMPNDYLGLQEFYCPECGEKTLHNEEAVVERSCSSVWYCLFCGHEYKPSGGNSLVPA